MPLLNTEHDIVQIPRRTVIGKLQPMDVTNLKASNILWTIDGTASTTGTHMQLTCMPPESSFQPELKDSPILQDAKD